MFKNLKQTLIVISLLFITASPCKAMELVQVEKKVTEAIPEIPNEVFLIILSFVPISELVYLVRINKSWAACIEKLLKHCPDKYIELCDIGFEKKKYSKLLEPIFDDYEHYKKLIKWAERKNHGNKECDELKEEFFDRVKSVKTESPKDFFALTCFIKQGPFMAFLYPAELNFLISLKSKKIIALMLSLGCCLDDIKNEKDYAEIFSWCEELCKQLESSSFSEDKFKKELDTLKKNYVVPNFYRNRRGQTPLYSAVQEGNQKAAELLVFSGADINAKVSDEETPFLITYNPAFKQFALARFFIENGADLSLRYGPRGLVVECLAEGGDAYFEEIKFLVEHGAPRGDALIIAGTYNEQHEKKNPKIVEYLRSL